VDRWLGIADATLSVMARELCCLVGTDSTSFEKAAFKLRKLGQIDISPERLRTVVEAEGRQVLELRRQGLLGPDWDASDCTVDADGKTRVLVGADGVMVPVITAAEKAKRRAGRRHVRRRKAKRKVHRHRGSDQPWKEFKIGQFYSSDGERCWAFATKGNHEEFGRQLRREAAKVRLGQADERQSLSDGAEWIRKQFRQQLPMLTDMILDFYHVAERVGQVSAMCWGLEAAASKEWTGKVLHSLKHEGPLALLRETVQAKAKLRGAAKRKALGELEQYVSKRTEMMDYPRYIASGFAIGSGPTEAKCKTVPARLKGSGMRWNLPNAEAMAALACVEQSGVLSSYWVQQRQRVA
jgi:hypothetical protein